MKRIVVIVLAILLTAVSFSSVPALAENRRVILWDGIVWGDSPETVLRKLDYEGPFETSRERRAYYMLFPLTPTFTEWLGELLGQDIAEAFSFVHYEFDKSSDSLISIQILLDQESDIDGQIIGKTISDISEYYGEAPRSLAWSGSKYTIWHGMGGSTDILIIDRPDWVILTFADSMHWYP